MADRPVNLVQEALTICIRERNLSVRAMAEELGLSHPTVSALLAGTTDITLSTLQRIARHFGWTPGETGVAAFYEPPARPKKPKGPGSKT